MRKTISYKDLVMLMKAIGYVRTSTDVQSPDRQIDQIEKYCQMREWELGKIHKDIDVSGVELRPNLEKALDALDFDVLIVTELDRLGRNTLDLLTKADYLMRHGKGLVIIQQAIDTTTEFGTLLFQILSAFAEFERKMIRERMRLGRERAKAKGKSLGRKFTPLPEAKIRELRERGLSFADIKRLLDLKVHPSTLGRRFS